MSRRKSGKSKLREDVVPYRVQGTTEPLKLRFIDFFCGIGGFRFAFERAVCQCVFSCDWNEPAQRTYAANFGETPVGDIHKAAVADILAHDILCGGFPCQPFSIAGVSKKLTLAASTALKIRSRATSFSRSRTSSSTTSPRLKEERQEPAIRIRTKKIGATPLDHPIAINARSN